jgi:hypothetical protein
MSDKGGLVGVKADQKMTEDALSNHVSDKRGVDVTVYSLVAAV